LLLEEASLESPEERFGLSQGQSEMFDALAVFVEGEDIGDGLLLTLIAVDDQLEFEAHRGAFPGSSGR
jgi:hypothetical protein